MRGLEGDQPLEGNGLTRQWLGHLAARNHGRFPARSDHGYFDYLPTPKQHELGGYETWLATNRLEPKASDKMLDALLEMAAEVRSAAAQ